MGISSAENPGLSHVLRKAITTSSRSQLFHHTCKATRMNNRENTWNRINKVLFNDCADGIIDEDRMEEILDMCEVCDNGYDMKEVFEDEYGELYDEIDMQDAIDTQGED